MNMKQTCKFCYTVVPVACSGVTAARSCAHRLNTEQLWDDVARTDIARANIDALLKRKSCYSGVSSKDAYERWLAQRRFK